MSKKFKENTPQKRTPKFVGIAFEMAITIGLFVYLGVQADLFFETGSQICTALFSLFGVLLAIFNLIRKANRG